MSRFTARACFWPFEVLIVSSSSSASASSSTCSSRSRTDSAPMPPRKYSPHPNGEPKRSLSSRNVVSSLITSFGFISMKIFQTSRMRSAASPRYSSVSAISPSKVFVSSLTSFLRSSSLILVGFGTVSAQSSSSSSNLVVVPSSRYLILRCSASFSSLVRCSRSFSYSPTILSTSFSSFLASLSRAFSSTQVITEAAK